MSLLASVGHWLRALARHPADGTARIQPPAAEAVGQPPLLAAYLRLGHRPGGVAPFEQRLELLLSQLSAELSGCAWCIEQGRHRWRKAGLPELHLRALRGYEESRLFSGRERAALAFGEAVAHCAEVEIDVPVPVVAEMRRHFSEREIVRLVVLAVGEHFGDRLIGSFGYDSQPPFPIAVRGLS